MTRASCRIDNDQVQFIALFILVSFAKDNERQRHVSISNLPWPATPHPHHHEPYLRRVRVVTSLDHLEARPPCVKTSLGHRGTDGASPPLQPALHAIRPAPSSDVFVRRFAHPSCIQHELESGGMTPYCSLFEVHKVLCGVIPVLPGKVSVGTFFFPGPNRHIDQKIFC